MSYHFVITKLGAIILLLGVFIAACNLPSATPTAGSTAHHQWFVSPSGNDSNDCQTPASACRTILEALDRSTDGDYIRVAPGSYQEISSDYGAISLNVTIYINKDVTLAGDDRDSTVVITGEPEADYVMAIDADADVRISGMTIIQSNADSIAAVLVNGNLTLENVVVRDSTAMGIYNISGDVTMINSIVSGNMDYGIKNIHGANLTMRGSYVTENAKQGLYNYGFAQINDSTFHGNQTSGIDNFDGGQLYLSTSTLSGNFGEGLHNQGIAVLVNSTVSSNVPGGTREEYGGTGILATGLSGNLILNLTTIANNNRTGLIFAAGTLSVRNTLISNNAGGDCGYGVSTLTYAYSIFARGYNLDSDGSCSSPGRRGAEGDMFLGPLADNGGATQTHALLEGHPAIDSAGTCGIDTDQRGISRPIGGGCDIGAYEYTFAVSAVEQTATPELIPLMTDTPTSTDTSPGVKAFKNSNCRYGPGVAYDIADTLLLDQSALVIGRNEEASWFQIKGPVTGTKCWVSLASVDVTGPVANVPVVVVDAPPTPEVNGCFVYNQQQQAVCVVPCPANAQPGGACAP